MTTADMLRAEGRRRGQREMLLKLLNQRFGALPEDAMARIDTAGPAELEAWFDRGLTASTLAGALGDS